METNKILEERLEEEAEDVCKYYKLSKDAEEDGNKFLSEKLKMIAYDEFTHAHAFHSMLEKHGYRIRPDIVEKWEKAKRTFEKM